MVPTLVLLTLLNNCFRVQTVNANDRTATDAVREALLSFGVSTRFVDNRVRPINLEAQREVPARLHRSSPRHDSSLLQLGSLSFLFQFTGHWTRMDLVECFNGVATSIDPSGAKREQAHHWSSMRRREDMKI